MFTLIKALIITLIFQSIVCKDSEDVVCDNNTVQRVDDYVSRLTTYGNSGRKFPEIASEFPKYCNETKTILLNIEKLNKNCLQGLAKNILTVGMYTITKKMKRNCVKNHSPSAGELAAAKCVNKASNLINKCFTKGIDNLLGIQTAEEKKRIPMACCEVTKVKECITKIHDKVDICTEEHADITARFIDSVIGNSLNFACAEYSSDSDKCSALKVPKKRKNQRRTKSMIVAFLRLFETFPEANKQFK